MTPLEQAAMPIVWTYAAIVGALVGSFLNVVVARVPAGLSVVRPRSRCPGCLTPIAWYDNVPVVSWLLLGGRCRSCAARISFRYPLVELLGAAIAVVAVLRHGPSSSALAEFGLVSTLLALACIDLDTWLLPHVLTIPLLVAGVALSALGITAAPSMGSSLLGAAVGWGAFAAVSFVGEKVFRKEALGFGDVWLLSAIGAWTGVAAILPVVLLASLQGTAVGLGLILLGRAQPGPREPPADSPSPEQAAAPDGAATDEEGAPANDPDADWIPPRNAVPFGPFLALGAVEWLWAAGWLSRAFPVLSLFR